MNNPEVTLALTENWWIRWRCSQPIRKSLVRAFVTHWNPIVRSAILENKKRHKRPGTWADFATELYRDYPNVWRWTAGTYALSMADYMCIAGVLNVHCSTLVPDFEKWLTTATGFVCKGNIQPNEAQAYVKYRLGNPTGFNPHLDKNVVRGIASSMPDSFESNSEVEGAIFHTANQIGSVLQKLAEGKE